MLWVLMLFVQDDKDSVREEEKFQRKKKKLKNSEILETLREEFGQAPEVARSASCVELSNTFLNVEIFVFGSGIHFPGAEAAAGGRGRETQVRRGEIRAPGECRLNGICEQLF
jgi:hypothetical protein